jgi:hypothetical protein
MNLTGKDSQLTIVISNPNPTINRIIISTNWFIRNIMPCWSMITNTFENFTSISISIIFLFIINIGIITNNNLFANIIIYWNWSNYPFKFNFWCSTIKIDFLTCPFIENNRCFLYGICFRTISIVISKNKIIVNKIYYETELLTCYVQDSPVLPSKTTVERHKHLMMGILVLYDYWHNL